MKKGITPETGLLMAVFSALMSFTAVLFLYGLLAMGEKGGASGVDLMVESAAASLLVIAICEVVRTIDSREER